MIQRAVNPINVIYASYEDNIDEINSRGRNIFDNFTWTEKRRAAILEHFHPVPMRQHGPVWAPDLGKHIQNHSQATPAAFSLQKICEARLAKLLIIDPLSAGFYGDENSKGTSYEISVYPT